MSGINSDDVEADSTPPAQEALLTVPGGFELEVRRALEGRRAGDLAMLAAETRGVPWEVGGLRVAGRALVAIEAYTSARRVWEAVLGFHPGDTEASLLLRTIDERLRDLAPALAERSSEAVASAPLRVLLFTGHQIDRLGRASPRFPADKEAGARRRIREEIERACEGLEDAPKLGLAGAASGGDILFHEVCAELGIPTHVYLALPDDMFITESVAPADANWVERFRTLLQGKNRDTEVRQLAESKEMPEWLESAKAGYGIWQRNNLWMLHNALALGGSHTTLIALWDGKGGDGPGGTADMVEQAEKLGARVVRIDTAREFGLGSGI